jgi:hypothetical protein
VQLGSEQFQSSLKNTDEIPFVIDMMNNVREKLTIYK